jgi:hypothetical protein
MPTSTLVDTQLSPIVQTAECFVPPEIKNLFVDYRFISKAVLAEQMAVLDGSPSRHQLLTDSCFKAAAHIMKAVKVKVLAHDSIAIIPKLVDVHTLDRSWDEIAGKPGFSSVYPGTCHAYIKYWSSSPLDTCTIQELALEQYCFEAPSSSNYSLPVGEIFEIESSSLPHHLAAHFVPEVVATCFDFLARRAGLQGTIKKDALRFLLGGATAGITASILGAEVLPAVAGYAALKGVKKIVGVAHNFFCKKQIEKALLPSNAQLDLETPKEEQVHRKARKPQRSREVERFIGDVNAPRRLRNKKLVLIMYPQAR